jgi:hypothetical protein
MFISTFWHLGGRFDKHNSLMPNFASLKKLTNHDNPSLAKIQELL